MGRCARWLIPAALTLSHPAIAADITAEQSALMYDLLDPAVKGGAPPQGVDATIFNNAIAILKQEQLAGQSARPNFNETGILETYGKALFLGARAPQFAADIGKIRDLVSKGDRPALEQALKDLWVKSGRTAPDAKALDPIIKSLYGAKDQEPEETVRHVIDRPKYRMEMTHARAGGRMQVDVITKNADGADKDRTAFQGVTETAPTANGQDLQRRIKLDKICTSTAQTDAATKPRLTGEWTDHSGIGNSWVIAQSGDTITLDEKRGGHPAMRYTGTYKLGKIAAAHPITAITDMDDNLPAQVRGQLIGGKISFRVALDFCGDDAHNLKGTWSSQHVTYNSMSLEIKRIHDPYDLSLVLSKGTASLKSAPGAAPRETL